ncbi:MAG: hypothetical protein JMDDDDMK_00454 [Acidobacteria bacterium]|nr:hypothetical protein [Acidobacteriota bacterium]
MRRRRIQRRVSGAGFQNAEDAYHRFHRTLETKADNGFRPHSQSPQVSGQLIGPGVEFGVSQLPFFEDHRQVFRRLFYLLFKKPVNEFVFGIIGVRIVERGQQLKAVGVAQHLQFADRSFGVLGGASQKRLEMVCQTLDIFAAEPFGIVMKLRREQIVRPMAAELDVKPIRATDLFVN